MYTSLFLKSKNLLFFLATPEVFIMAAMASLFVSFIEKYLFCDWELLSWISILIGLEFLVKTYIAFREKKFSSKSIDPLLQKCILYSICLILGHILKNYTIDKRHPTHLDWLSNYLAIGLILRETLSIIETLSRIKGFIPRWLLAKLGNMGTHLFDFSKENKEVFEERRPEILKEDNPKTSGKEKSTELSKQEEKFILTNSKNLN